MVALEAINMQQVGERLHMLRWRHGWSLKQLEAISGVPESSILRYERQQSKPDADRLAALALALGTTTDYLLGLTDDPAVVDPGSTTRVWLKAI